VLVIVSALVSKSSTDNLRVFLQHRR